MNNALYPRITVRLTALVRLQLEEAAKAEGVKVSTLVQKAIVEYLDRKKA